MEVKEVSNKHASSKEKLQVIFNMIISPYVQLMSKYLTGLVFRQLALVPFPDSMNFGCCLKSEIENPEPSEFYSFKSIQTDRIWFKYPKNCLK